MADFQQVEYLSEYGTFESSAAKGWVKATIAKDGFSIGLFTTHTQADYGAEDCVVRSIQILQLKEGISSYRRNNPSHAVFIMGDFNIYGEPQEYQDLCGREEYQGLLIPQMFLVEEGDGRDADRNSLGFFQRLGGNEQWTYCACNPLALYFDDAAQSGRLNYIFYFPSYDGSIEVLPVSTRVIQFEGGTSTCQKFTELPTVTSQSSDHWSVYGKFKLIRH